MVWYSIDSVIKNVLLRRGYPIHFYLDFLISGKDGVRQLAIDSMPIINTVLLPLSASNAAQIPDDFVDYTKIGIRVGQMVKPLVEKSSINRLVYYGSAGTPDKYNGITDIPSATNSGLAEPYLFGWDTVTWDSYGEYVGRQYGFRGSGSEWDSFAIIPERGEIQCDENLDVSAIVVEYVSDGMSADAASKIHAYAVDTLEAYMIWQFKENNRTYNLGERQLAKDEYTRQYQIFLARQNPLTIEVLKRIVNRNYRGSIRT